MLQATSKVLGRHISQYPQRESVSGKFQYGLRSWAYGESLERLKVVEAVVFRWQLESMFCAPRPFLPRWKKLAAGSPRPVFSMRVAASAAVMLAAAPPSSLSGSMSRGVLSLLPVAASSSSLASSSSSPSPSSSLAERTAEAAARVGLYRTFLFDDRGVVVAENQERADQEADISRHTFLRLRFRRTRTKSTSHRGAARLS